MKKWIAMFCVMVSILSGCSNHKEEAIDAAILAIQHMQEVKTADFTLQMKLSMDMEEITAKLYGAYDIKDDVKMKMTLKANLDGEADRVASLYVNDEVLYLESEGEKEAVSLTPMDQGSTIQGTLLPDKNALYDMISSAQMKDDHILLTIDSEDVHLDELLSELGMEDMEDMTLTVSDITLDMLIQDDMVANVVMDYTVSSKWKGLTAASVDFHFTLGFSNINQEHTIEFPNFNDFPLPTDIYNEIDYI